MRTHKMLHKMASNEGDSSETMCSSCFNNTKYRCMQCYNPFCNRCSIAEINDDAPGWKAGYQVGYCFGLCKTVY